MYVAAQIISLYLSRPNVVSRECRLLVYIMDSCFVFFFPSENKEK